MPGGSFRSHSSFQTRDLSRRELQHPWPFCSLTMSQTFHTEQFYYRMLTWWPTEEKLNHCSSSSPRVWTKRRPNIHFLSFSRFYSLIAAPLHKTQIMCKRGVTEEKEELKLSSRGDFGVKVLLQRRSRGYRCSVCLWWLHDHHLRNAADNQELQELLSHSAAFSLSVEGWLKAQQLCWWQAVVTTSTEHQHSSTNKWEECVCIKASEWPVKADLKELLLATATSPGFHVQADPEKLVDALVSIRPDRWTPQKTINQSTLLHYTKVHCTKTSHWLQVSYKVDLKVVFRLRWHEGHGDRMKPSGSSTWNNPQADTDKLTCPKNERC